MKEKVEAFLRQSVQGLMDNGEVPRIDNEYITVSIPQNRQFGDFATNIAMVMASMAKRSPREVAATIKTALSIHNDFFDRIDIAGPGFINFFIQPAVWVDILKDVHEMKGSYGNSTHGRGKKVQVEFVSANPTGPLHVGHGRGAAVGDTLARILSSTGFEVEKEYYINDVGNQMNTLGRSVLFHYRQILGVDGNFPEDGYKGEYIKDIAQDLNADLGNALLGEDEIAAVQKCREYASKKILQGIKDDLELFNIRFDRWFSEANLYKDNRVNDTLEYMEKKGLIYEEDGALWFRTSRFGDEKDRVLKKQDGSFTYFAPDIAYHKNKLDRGFEQIIDIWGADHHGYVPRMKAAIEALGAGKDSFEALLIQLVSLVRNHKPVQMSTRAGEFVTLKEIIDEVGTDVGRYFFLMRKCDSQLVFDLDLAKKKSDENPVYYIQYAHARICSIIRNASEQDAHVDIHTSDTGILSEGEDLELIKMVAAYPDVLISSADNLEPHRIAFYLLDLASSFHKFYNKNRVITEDKALTSARLVLIDAVRQVIANGLDLMGIKAPESM